MLKKQKIFNHVVAALVEQSEFSALEGRCKYRGPNNTKCAVGHLIPDDKYHRQIEGRLAHDYEVVRLFDPKFVNPRGDLGVEFLRDLQTYLHDSLFYQPFDLETFRAAAWKFARKYGLKVDVNLFEKKG